MNIINTNYDENGNLIHCKYDNGYEEKFKYNEEGQMIFSKDSDDVKIWFDHDENGNCTHLETSSRYHQWMTYDENGKLIRKEDSNGNKMTY